METQVKERLTGAIILVALVVLLVPELLTGPHSAAAPAAVNKANDAPLRSYTVNLAADGSTPRQQAAPVALPPKDAVAKGPTPEESEALEAKLLPQSPAQELPPAPAVEKQATVERPPVEAKPPPPASPPLRKGWSVQLGTFKSRDNAQRLAKQLKSKGFNAFVADGGGKNGKLYRVRVGPVADRAAASALAAKLRQNGHTGSVVTYP